MIIICGVVENVIIEFRIIVWEEMGDKKCDVRIWVDDDWIIIIFEHSFLLY